LTRQSPIKNKNLDEIKPNSSQLESTNQRDRKHLLKDFINLKKRLESMGRELAFLSIDVVDSTGMKEGEDPYTVAYTFNEYRNFVETRINANGCIKSTWTPDGLMACFSKLDDAIKSSQILLKDLVDFNKEVKSIKRDFMIRCGINTGRLFFDDSLPLEQITDRVIDIAGHMQKHADPNTIYIAKQVIKPMDYIKGFVKTSVDIDGLNVYRWDDKKEGK